MEGREAQPVPAARAERERSVGLLHRVAALAVDRLTGALRVEEEAGEVLEDPERPVRAEDLLGDHAVAERRLQIERERVPHRVTALAGILAAVEIDAAGIDVVLPHHTGRLVVRRVGGREYAKEAALTQLALVLRHRAGVSVGA